MSLTAQAVKNAQLISLIQIYGHRWIWNIQIPSMRRKALWQNPLNGSKDDCSGIVNFIILLERAELHKATSKLGKYKKAVELLQQMPQAGLSPKTFTVVLVLNACADHKQLKRAGISTNRIIKHIWESEVQWHVASSPRNMRNAEPARIA